MKNTELLERFNERINPLLEVYEKDDDVSAVIAARCAFDDAKRILADIVKYEEIVCGEDDLK